MGIKIKQKAPNVPPPQRELSPEPMKKPLIQASASVISVTPIESKEDDVMLEGYEDEEGLKVLQDKAIEEKLP